GHPRRAAHLADPHRVRAAGAADGQPAPGAAAQPHLRRGVGLRLPDLRQRARGLHRLPAPQDRGRGGDPADPHRARHRLRAAGHPAVTGTSDPSARSAPETAAYPPAAPPVPPLTRPAPRTRGVRALVRRISLHGRVTALAATVAAVLVVAMTVATF